MAGGRAARIRAAGSAAEGASTANDAPQLPPLPTGPVASPRSIPGCRRPPPGAAHCTGGGRSAGCELCDGDHPQPHTAYDRNKVRLTGASSQQRLPQPMAGGSVAQRRDQARAPGRGAWAGLAVGQLPLCSSARDIRRVGAPQQAALVESRSSGRRPDSGHTGSTEWQTICLPLGGRRSRKAALSRRLRRERPRSTECDMVDGWVDRVCHLSPLCACGRRWC